MSNNHSTIWRITIVATVMLAVMGALAGCRATSFDLPEPDTAARPFSNEQEWIVSDISATIVDFARAQGADLPTEMPAVTIRTAANSQTLPSFAVSIGSSAPVMVTVSDHIWSAGTYRALAERLMPAHPPAGPNGASASPDLNIRAALTDLRTETLLEASDRVSGMLTTNPLSASAHESAALLLGAFALRESSGWFQDIRPALSRMTAHLAVAQVLRGAEPASHDGRLADIVMNTLIERERHATTLLDGFEAHATDDADVAWAHAMRFRLTGDWRRARSIAEETGLEQLEHGRALRERLDIDEFMDYVQQTPGWHERIDWPHLAYKPYVSVEAGHYFGSEAMLERQLGDANLAWRHYHQGAGLTAQLIHDLNDRPGRGGPVLDWGLWAGQQQRHLLRALSFVAYHQINLGRFDANQRQAYLAATTETFGTLTLYPIMLRGLADDRATYERALKLARPVVAASPELVTPEAWHLLLDKPSFMNMALPFPVDIAWFTPTVPAGTALELEVPSLRPNCPRPPTQEELAAWAAENPHGRHTQWSHEWMRVPGKPALTDVRRSMTPLFAYDAQALALLLDYMELPDDLRMNLARQACTLMAGRCEDLARIALLAGRQDEALAAYERWHATTRDRIGVSNGLTFLMRYYLGHRQQERADAITREAADTGSAQGMEVRGEFLDRLGRSDEAEALYRQVASSYSDSDSYLGIFLMRRALKRGSRSVPTEAAEKLQTIFPGGMEPFVRLALPATPNDGAIFVTFGPRAAATGLKPADVIVAVDGWRVHDNRQALAVLRMSFDEAATFTVWRGNRYESVNAHIPERWFGATFDDYREPVARR